MATQYYKVIDKNGDPLTDYNLLAVTPSRGETVKERIIQCYGEEAAHWTLVRECE